MCDGLALPPGTKTLPLARRHRLSVDSVNGLHLFSCDMCPAPSGVNLGLVELPRLPGATVSGRPTIAARQCSLDWSVVAADEGLPRVSRRADSLMVPSQIGEKCLRLRRPFYLSHMGGQHETDSSLFPYSSTPSWCKVLLGASCLSAYACRHLHACGALVKTLTGPRSQTCRRSI